MKQMRKYQDRVLRKFEQSKEIVFLSETAKAAMRPWIYRMAGEAYKKGFKRCKNIRVEQINNLNIQSNYE